MESSKDAAANSTGECSMGIGKMDVNSLEGEAEAGSERGFEIQRLTSQAGLGGRAEPY